MMTSAEIDIICSSAAGESAPALSYSMVLARALEIREKVFIQGQNVPRHIEIDGLDDQAVHYLLFLKGLPVGTARTRTIDQAVKIERLAILPVCQRQGLGKTLMARIIKDSLKAAPKEIVLHAQFHLADFYSGLGFKKRGKIFYDAGIRHIEMYRKALNV
jgi:cystathionine beta-lyase